MTKLSERMLMDAPLAQAGARVTSFFHLHTKQGEDAAQLPLRFNIDVPGLAKPLALSKTVVATFVPEHNPSDMVPRYRVTWTPKDGGPFPNFDGELYVDGDQDYDRFWLILEGNYSPPGGLVGEAFDAIAGHAIATATARDLLERIRSGVEAEFRKAEEAKRSAPVRPLPST
ncbi:MAG: hypothetical protein WAJ85_05960 [Candidatus Baltobacteraceae bacterium]|jgi:hypothetical protein